MNRLMSPRELWISILPGMPNKGPFLMGPKSILMVSHPLGALKYGKGPDLTLCNFQDILPNCECQNSVLFLTNYACRPYLRSWNAFYLEKVFSASSFLYHVEKRRKQREPGCSFWKQTCRCIIVISKWQKVTKQINNYKPTTKYNYCW